MNFTSSLVITITTLSKILGGFGNVPLVDIPVRSAVREAVSSTSPNECVCMSEFTVCKCICVSDDHKGGVVYVHICVCDIAL